MAELSVSGPEVLYNDDSEISFKRAKREQCGLIGKKNVVVLKSGDVVRRNGYVFMPNTIEMACIKKPATGQFKTNVEFSSVMSEDDVMARLEETFPILTGQRVFCAAASNFRTRLEFHGKPRLWDGRCIKKWIKGNSALYVLTELKGGQDVMFEQSLGKSHQDPDLAVLHNFPNGLKLPLPRLATSFSKRWEQKAIPGTLGNQIDIATTAEGQRLMVTAGYSTLSATGINAQNASCNQKVSGLHQASQCTSVVSSQMRQMHISSTAPSSQQPLKTSYVIAATTQGNSSIQSVQVPLSSNPLQGSQSVMKETDRSMTLEVSMETTRTLGSGVADMPGCCSLMQPSGQHGDLSHNTPRALSCATGHSHDSLHLSSLAETSELDSNRFNTVDSFQLSAPPQTSASSIGSTPNSESTRPQSTTEEEEEDSGQEEISMGIEFGDGSPLCLLSRVASKIRSTITKDSSIVRDISPKSSTLEGGVTFYIILEKRLPREVTEGKAFFGDHGPPVSLNAVNRWNFKGVVPPSPNPGIVSVRVETSEGKYLGQSLFQYRDQIRDLVQKMAHNVKLQADFFQLLSNELGKKPETEEHDKDCSKQRPSTVQNTGYSEGEVSNNEEEVHPSTSSWTRFQIIVWILNRLSKRGSRREILRLDCQYRENRVVLVLHQPRSSYPEEGTNHDARFSAEQFHCEEYEKCLDAQDLGNKEEISHDQSSRNEETQHLNTDIYHGEHAHQSPNFGEGNELQEDSENTRGTQDCDDLRPQRYCENVEYNVEQSTEKKENEINGECKELEKDGENTRGTQDCVEVRPQRYCENVEYNVEQSTEKKENEINGECDELEKDGENTRGTQDSVEVRPRSYSENVEQNMEQSVEKREDEISGEYDDLNEDGENTRGTQDSVEVRPQSYSGNVEHNVEQSEEKKENEISRECDEQNKDGENTRGTQDCDEVRPQSYSETFEHNVNQSTKEKESEASTYKPDGGQPTQELQVLEGERAVDGSVTGVGDFHLLSLEASVDSHVRNIPQTVDHSVPITDEENTSIKAEDDEQNTQLENMVQVKNQPGASDAENNMVSEESFQAQGESSMEV